MIGQTSALRGGKCILWPKVTEYHTDMEEIGGHKEGKQVMVSDLLLPLFPPCKFFPTVKVFI